MACRWMYWLSKAASAAPPLSRMENAEVSPTAQVLGKLCAVYGLTTSRLLYMVESDAPTKTDCGSAACLARPQERLYTPQRFATSAGLCGRGAAM